MTVPRKLGRGLHALLGGLDEDHPVAGVVGPSPSVGELQELPLTNIDVNPYQPRRQFDETELAELAQSIRTHGVIQPIVVRPAGDRFQIVAGERRFRAAHLASITRIPARIIPLDEKQTCEVALIENLQRADLNAIEKAQAFERYLERFGSTHEALANELGVDRSTVTNLVRLLELPEPVQQAVRTGQASNGHARSLLALNDSAEQIALCKRIIAEGLSVRQVEQLVRERKTSAVSAPEPAATTPTVSNHVRAIEADLQRSLGTKVEIRQREKDKGTITIHFQSLDDFERVTGALRGSASH